MQRKSAVIFVVAAILMLLFFLALFQGNSPRNFGETLQILKGPSFDVQTDKAGSEIRKEASSEIPRGPALSEVRKEIMSEVLSEVRKEVLSEVRRSILSEVQKEVASEVEKKVQKDIFSEVQKDILSEVQKEVASEVEKKVKKDILSGVQKDILSEVQKDILSEVQKEVASEVQKKVQKDIFSEVQKDILSEVQKEVASEVEKKVQKDVLSEVQKEIISKAVVANAQTSDSSAQSTEPGTEEEYWKDEEIFQLQEKLEEVDVIQRKMAKLPNQLVQANEKLRLLQEELLEIQLEHPLKPEEIKTVTKPELPARMEIGGIRPGSRFIVSGVYLGGQLAVELFLGDKLAFHLSLREDMTVLNDRYEGWGSETQLTGMFGQRGATFNLELKVLGKAVHIDYNGSRKETWEFRRSFDGKDIRQFALSCKENSCATIETVQAIKVN